MKDKINKEEDGFSPDYIAQMENLIEDAVSEDSEKEEKADIRGKMESTECLLPCTLRDKVHKLKNDLDKKIERIRNLTSENENLRKGLEKNVDNETRNASLVKAMKDDFIQAQKKKNTLLELELKEQKEIADKFRIELKKLKEKNDEFLKAYDTDNKLREKYSYMKMIEERTLRLNNEKHDLKDKIYALDRKEKELQFKVMKLSEALVERTAELKHMLQLEKDIKMRAKGMSLTPKKEPALRKPLFQKLKNKIKENKRKKEQWSIPG